MQQQQYMPYMQMMNLPNQYCPMMDMQQDQLESMYPNVYHKVYPHVKQQCDMYDKMYGMQNPNRQQVDAMVDDIYRKCEGHFDDDYMDDQMQRQFGFGPGFGHGFGFGHRRFGRDLITILLLRELIGRRRPFFFGFPGHFF
jgi:hypothetical protein